MAQAALARTKVNTEVTQPALGRGSRPSPGRGKPGRPAKGPRVSGDARESVRQPATAGEGARFWGGVMNDLRNRGVRDILIACCDGLAGFEDAITAAFGRTVVQRCVVHLIRNALRPVARRDAGEVAKELRKIYTAPTAEAAFDALAAFASSGLGKKYPQGVGGGIGLGGWLLVGQGDAGDVAGLRVVVVGQRGG